MQIEYSQTSLQQIINRIENGEISVPPFQRTFDWSAKDMCQFFNSIIQGEPFGSIMLWYEESNDLILGQTSKYFKRLAKREISESNKTYLIDGQQRVTSFVQLYLLENNEVSTHLDKSKSIYYDFIENKFVVRKKGTNGLLSCAFFKKDFSNLKISAKESITNLNNVEWTEEIGEKLKETHMKFNSIHVGETKVISKSLDDVIRVFTLINTKGKKLTAYNIVHAQFVSKDHNLESKFEDINKEIVKTYGSNWKINNPNLLTFAYASFSQTISSSEILKKSQGKNINIEDDWNYINDKFQTVLIKTISDLKILGFKALDWLPSLNIFNILSFINNNLDNKVFTSTENNIIKNWLKIAVINERFNSGNDGLKQTGFKLDSTTLLKSLKMKKDICDIFVEKDNWISKDKFELTDIKFESYNSSSALYKYIISKIIHNIPSFLTGNIINFDESYKLKELNIHHIFPQSHPDFKDEDLVQTIGNLTPLEFGPNIDINNNSPKKYIKKLIEEKETNAETLKKAHMNFSFDSLKEFVEWRVGQILDIVNK